MDFRFYLSWRPCILPTTISRKQCIFLRSNPHWKRIDNGHSSRIAENLEQYIPNLDTLMLNNNMFQELNEIDPLATLPKLAHIR